MKPKCVALLLAGGQGKRLFPLVKNSSKPAVSFGGKYRIIDFTLSNLKNSDIDTVGVLTQYQPFELNEYLGSGEAWDLNLKNGGLYVLPPYTELCGGNFYSGTADAVYKNLNFLNRFEPECVLILSADHIYFMDYSKLIDFHNAKKADLTICTTQVDIKDAKRYGIILKDQNNKIISFEEKPKKPKSDRASMGVYVFNFRKLKKYLKQDFQNEKSNHDFGKDIIPLMLKQNEKVFSFDFNGYFRDVGTSESFWKANMDVLERGLQNKKIYTKNSSYKPHLIKYGAEISNSLVSNGARVLGTVKNSLVFENAEIKSGAEIINSIIMSNAVVEENARVHNAIIANDARVKKSTSVVGKNGEIAVIAANIKTRCSVQTGDKMPLCPIKEEIKNEG